MQNECKLGKSCWEERVLDVLTYNARLIRQVLDPFRANSGADRELDRLIGPSYSSVGAH